MKLKLFRTIFTKDTTHGVLSINGVFFCHTIEDTDCRLEDNPEGKIYGRTAIPRGTYKIIVSFSNRFQKWMLEVLAVPNYDGVRIHGGRDHRDTEGCPLVGQLVGERLVNGIAISARLLAVVQAAIERGEDVELEVA